MPWSSSVALIKSKAFPVLWKKKRSKLQIKWGWVATGQNGANEANGNKVPTEINNARASQMWQ